MQAADARRKIISANENPLLGAAAVASFAVAAVARVARPHIVNLMPLHSRTRPGCGDRRGQHTRRLVRHVTQLLVTAVM
jgi:hypothetical protein